MHNKTIPILLALLTAATHGHCDAEVSAVSENSSQIVSTKETGVNKLHILYLLQSKEFNRAIDLYREYKEALGRHDFEILQQMNLTELGCKMLIIESNSIEDYKYINYCTTFGMKLYEKNYMNLIFVK